MLLVCGGGDCCVSSLCSVNTECVAADHLLWYLSLNNSSQGQKHAPHVGIVPQFWDRQICNTWSCKACQSRELLHVNWSCLVPCRKRLLGAGWICLWVCLSSQILRYGSIKLCRIYLLCWVFQDVLLQRGDAQCSGACPLGSTPAHLSQLFLLSGRFVLSCYVVCAGIVSWPS